MLGIKVEITRFVEAGYPGLVECSLIDAQGQTHFFIDKVPVVAFQDLDENSPYPTDGFIACQVINSSPEDESIVTVSTENPWHIESTEETTEFRIRKNQLTELEDRKH